MTRSFCPKALPQYLHRSCELPLLSARILRERRRAILEELLLTPVEQRGLIVFLTNRRHRVPL
jgi:hypothetical protein